MRTDTSQLVPGYVLLEDVIGKSGRPIIAKNTVLTEEHIFILQKFLVEDVNVSGKKVRKNDNVKQSLLKKVEQAENEKNSFVKQYKQVVFSYKKLFHKWKNNISIDMPEVRKIYIPLVERMEDVERNIYTLYRHSTKVDYVFYHSVSLGLMAAYIARKMNYKKSEWLQIGLAGLLSDCGLAKVNPKLFIKNEYLTANEQEQIQDHPRYSYELTRSIPTITKAAKLAILQHHEHLDGSGYPLGLSHDKIHIYARIISVCNKYLEQTCTTLQKEGFTPFQSIKNIYESQYKTVDHRVVRILMSDFIKFAVGKKIRLSNGKLGEIIFMNEENIDKPIVRIENTDEIVVLENEQDLYIENIIYTS